MRRTITLLSLIALITVLFWFINLEYQSIYLQRGYYTFLALTINYIIFKLVFEELVIKGIKESKIRYSFKKMVSFIYIFVFLTALITIWVENLEVIAIAYGLIAAGIAISLQDFFKNIAGGIILFMSRIYSIGDRIEIESKSGDVIDIGILYTTIMETREWVSGDQATGRLSIIPNGQVISKTINNYTKDHRFLWDEITIPITYGSDWREAHTKILNIVKKETKDITDQAEKEITKLEEKYYLSKRSVEPMIYLTLTDNWITYHIRYITHVRERRSLRNKLSQMILDEIQRSEKIKIGSTTLDVIGFPEVRVKQNEH